MPGYGSFDTESYWGRIEFVTTESATELKFPLLCGRQWNQIGARPGDQRWAPSPGTGLLIYASRECWTGRWPAVRDGPAPVRPVTGSGTSTSLETSGVATGMVGPPLVERNVGMVERGQVDFPDPAQQIGAPLPRVELDPQHRSSDEHPGHIVERRHSGAGDRCADLVLSVNHDVVDR